MLKPDSPRPLLSCSPSRMEETVDLRFSSTFPNQFSLPITRFLHFTPKMTLPLIQQNFLSCNTLHHNKFYFHSIHRIAPNFTFVQYITPHKSFPLIVYHTKVRIKSLQSDLYCTKLNFGVMQCTPKFTFGRYITTHQILESCDMSWSKAFLVWYALSCDEGKF